MHPQPTTIVVIGKANTLSAQLRRIQTMGLVPSGPRIVDRAIYVQVGKRRFEVKSYKQASDALLRMLEQTGATFSGETGPKAPQPMLVDGDGNQIGYISQNGRVWKGNPRNWQSNELIYDPRAEPQDVDPASPGYTPGLSRQAVRQ